MDYDHPTRTMLTITAATTLVGVALLTLGLTVHSARGWGITMSIFTFILAGVFMCSAVYFLRGKADGDDVRAEAARLAEGE